MEKYLNDLKKVIKLVYPYAVKFYGKEYEDIICESLKEIEFYYTEQNETVYKAISRITNCKYIEKDNQNLTTCAVYYSKKTIGPSLEIKKRRIVVFSSAFTILSLEGIALVAHEVFSHAVQDNKFSDHIYNNSLISKSGLILYSCDIEFTDGKVIEKESKTENIVFNEIVTTYIEESITRKLYKNYKSPYYNFCKNVSYELFKCEDFKKKLIRYLLLHDINIKEYYGSKGSFDELSTFIDKYHENQNLLYSGKIKYKDFDSIEKQIKTDIDENLNKFKIKQKIMNS